MIESTEAHQPDTSPLTPQRKSLRHARRGLWLFAALAWCLGAASTLQAQPTPTNVTTQKASSKSVTQTLYLYRDGTVIGLILRYKKPYPVEVMINAAHRLHWLRLQIGGVRLLILGQGGVLIDQMQPRPKDRIVFQGQGRLDAIGKVKCKYDLNGRISQIGTMTFGYDPQGRLSQLGTHNIVYRNDLKVESVGSHKLSYRSEGRLGSLGPLNLTYRTDGKLSTIGKLTLRYHPLRGVIVRSEGSEERIKLQVQWTTLGIYRILRKK